ncbi:MAG TPA: ECF transporter S component [Anaerolineae bacterium]|nr:ECF transporter S component [Anaerolineae bacterium]
MTSRLGQALSATTLAAATVLGIWVVLSPFISVPGTMASSTSTPRAQSPFTFLVLLALCMLVIVANLETRRMDSKLVAVLGILVATNAVLRLVPGPAGFTAMLFLPILCGYAYGADFGFLLGALSFLVSAIVTGGLGPWLPYQMFSTGWMGMASACLPKLHRLGRLEVVPLALWGALLGLAFGVIMNLWFWPYVGDTGQSDMYWQPGTGTWETLGRYAAFYVTTSLWWDIGRAGGNLLLILLFGAPVLRLLRRFQRRFRFVTG